MLDTDLKIKQLQRNCDLVSGLHLHLMWKQVLLLSTTKSEVLNKASHFACQVSVLASLLSVLHCDLFVSLL